MVHPSSHRLSVFPPLQDAFGRTITYLRLSVTDRCNLRCRYCMPEQGMRWLPRKELLSWEELFRLIGLLTAAGVSKVRLTGGEPFARTGLTAFLRRVRESFPDLSLHLTTNGVLAGEKAEKLAQLGINGVNVSLDALNARRFADITGRDAVDKVLNTIAHLVRSKIPVKINMVVKDGFNVDEIIPVARLGEKWPIEIRFIEEMPALGGTGDALVEWTADRILEHLFGVFSGLRRQPNDGSTAQKFSVPGWPGTLGIIAGHSRLFCSTCNRLRLTASGVLKTCLYDAGVLNVKELLRRGADDEQVYRAVAAAVRQRPLDGFEAQATRHSTAVACMAEIGG